MESESLSQLDFTEFNVALLVVNAGLFKRCAVTDVQFPLRNYLLSV